MHTLSDIPQVIREMSGFRTAMQIARAPANMQPTTMLPGLNVPRAIEPLAEEGASLGSRVLSGAGTALGVVNAVLGGVDIADHMHNAVNAHDPDDPDRANDETGEALSTMFTGAVPGGSLLAGGVNAISEHFGGPRIGQLLGHAGSTPTDLIAQSRIETGDLAPHHTGGSNAYAQRRAAADEARIQAEILARQQRAAQEAAAAAARPTDPHDIMNRTPTPQSRFIPLNGGGQDLERAALGMAPIPQIHL